VIYYDPIPSYENAVVANMCNVAFAVTWNCQFSFVLVYNKILLSSNDWCKLSPGRNKHHIKCKLKIEK